MATKSKAPAKPANPLHDAFGKGVKLFEGGKLADAAKAMEEILGPARAAGDVHMVRSAQTYLTLCSQKAEAKADPSSPEVEGQLHINRKDPKGALSVLDKAVKAHPKEARLHYLKALAHAMLDQEEPAAASLKAAVELEPGLLYTFRLEPDFEEMRGSTAFAFTQGR